MASTVLPRAAARARRVDLRVLIALLLAGVLGTFAAVRRLAVHTPVLVMARQVQAGATIPLLSLTGGPVSPEQVAAESVTVGEHLWVLPGLPRSEPAGGGVLSPATARAVALAATRLPELEVVVADAGRLLPGSVAASLLEAADLGVLAARPDYLGAVAARRALDAAPGSPGRLVPVAVGVRRRWLGSVISPSLSRCSDDRWAGRSRPAPPDSFKRGTGSAPCCWPRPPGFPGPTTLTGSPTMRGWRSSSA